MTPDLTSEPRSQATPELALQVVAIAQEAGAAIMAVYQTGFEAAYKADGSPVTAADLAAHQLISQRLDALQLAPVVSEEAVPPWAERAGWPRLWLVDPLDGTREFMARTGEFAVSIALIEHGVPVLGVLHAPALGLSCWAVRGHGAWWREGGGRVQRLPVQQPAARSVAVSRFHPSAAVADFCAANPAWSENTLGSALKFAHLAAGQIGVYPRFSRISEWDIAAGQIIVQEAGGSMLDWASGEPPRYNSPTLAAPCFLALAPGVGRDELLFPATLAVG